MNRLPVLDDEPTARACCRWTPFAKGIVLGLSLAAIAGVGYGIGRLTAIDERFAEQSGDWNGIPRDRVPAELLQASATHGGANLAIATGQIDESSEGFFALDFLTGDLKCWVYYPRQGAFGGMFYTNVQAQLGMSKNPEYLLITGAPSQSLPAATSDPLLVWSTWSTPRADFLPPTRFRGTVPWKAQVRCRVGR